MGLDTFLTLVFFGLSMLSIGAYGALAYHCYTLTKRVDSCLKTMDDKIAEFKEVTVKASEANNSHAQALMDMQTEIVGLNERIHMLDANMKMGGKTGVWKN